MVLYMTGQGLRGTHLQGTQVPCHQGWGNVEDLKNPGPQFIALLFIPPLECCYI